MSNLLMKIRNEEVTKNVGLLKIKQSKAKFVSNASLIKGIQNPIVCTAAHCVFDWYKQQYASELTFITADNKEYEIDKIFISSEWTVNGVVDYDTAFLTLKDSNIETNDLMEPIFNYESKNQEVIIPFIKKNIFGKKKTGLVTGSTFEDHVHESSLIGLRDKMGVGSSGSPWILKESGKFYQFSNTSLSFNSAKNIIWGPSWGQHIRDIFLRTSSEYEKQDKINVFKL